MQLRSRLFRHINSLCMRFHGQQSSGELLAYVLGSPLHSISSGHGIRSVTRTLPEITYAIRKSLDAAITILFPPCGSAATLPPAFVNKPNRFPNSS